MSRKGAGLSAFSAHALKADQYASHGATLRSAHAEALETQLSVFQAALHNFSLTHGDEIRSNPTFRAEFARMCNAIGVDPLASSYMRNAASGGAKNAGGGGSGAGKAARTVGNIWTQMLGGSVNDFYFELAVRVVEVCRETRGENGGIIAVSDVCRRVEKGRGVGGGIEVSADDVVRAVESLAPLGSGFVVMQLGSTTMIRSVAKELNTDQATVLQAIQVLGYVSVSMLQDNLGWERPRSMAVLNDLLSDSLVWLDGQSREKEYWSPAFMMLAAG